MQAMQHLPIEKRLEDVSVERFIEHVPVEKRLDGLSVEEMQKILI